MNPESPKFAVVGLGHAGLPLAAALGRHFGVVGFDIDDSRIAELEAGHDRTREVETAALRAAAKVPDLRNGKIIDMVAELRPAFRPAQSVGGVRAAGRHSARHCLGRAG